MKRDPDSAKYEELGMLVKLTRNERHFATYDLIVG